MEESELVAAAAGAREVRVVVQENGSETRTPIWIVTVGGGAYIRSYKATSGQWYQYASRTRDISLEIADEDVEVHLEPVDDSAALEAVSDAYRSKYAGEPETPDMVTPEVAATTFQVTPR